MQLLNIPAQCKGCIRKPVMNFDPDQYMPDTLHLKKGIISKLVSQLVEWSLIQGKQQALLGQMKKHRIPFV